MAIKKVKDPVFITTINESKTSQSAMTDESEAETDTDSELELENTSKESLPADSETAMA